MSLLQTLSYQEYKYGCTLSTEVCEIIAKLANLKLPVNDGKKPGELLLKYLDRQGFSPTQYKKYLTKALNTKTIVTYYKPVSKVAILIANERYENLSKLATPSIDCDSLTSIFKNLGFVVVTIKNTTCSNLKDILKSIIENIPEDSYCFIFYAGHGCEIYNIKCILGINCPSENINLDHCITENWIIREVAKCKPDTCLMIMDMCRVYLNRDSNENIYTTMPIEDYNIHNNLIIGYSTLSSQAAYEVLQIECSETIDNNNTYQLKTGDTDKIVPGGSQYVNALCTRLMDNSDVNTLLDNVHKDMELLTKKQRPIKVQCGVSKRSLYDPAQENKDVTLGIIQKALQQYKDLCSVL